jgi:hypothetical protein
MKETKEIAKKIVQAVYDEDNCYDAYERVEEIIQLMMKTIILTLEGDNDIGAQRRNN